MKVHEYQAKELFKRYGIPIQDGYTIEDKKEIPKTIDRVANDFNAKEFVIKAQIHAGGRGKGGGVKFCPSVGKALLEAERILTMNLVTPQTGSEGKRVNKIMIAEGIDILNEYYVAITLDRSKAQNVFMVSQAGGVDIEEVAAKTPEKITKINVTPGLGLKPFQARQLAYSLGLTGDAFKVGIKIFLALYELYRDLDASLVEINPLVTTKEGAILALDGKINFDDNALYRQSEVAKLRDFTEEDSAEIEASEYNLNFIKLSGNVGCMVNGAGLAMATMDIIKLMGGEPANFLDVGGTASVETVKNAFRIILEDKNVKAILVNIFGGIVRCDRVAGGVISAVKELNLSVPVVVRLQGTNADIAREMFKKSEVNIISAKTIEEATKKVVQLVQ